MFGFFSSKINDIKEKVSKTAQALVGNLSNAVEGEEEFSEFLLEDMEDILIGADLGVNYAAELVDELRNKKNIKPTELKNFLKESFKTTLESCGDNTIKKTN